MPRLACLAVALLASSFAGCVHLPSRSARLEHCCEASARWTLALQVPSGPLRAGGQAAAIYREERWLSISLAVPPTPGNHRYGVDQIEIRETGAPARDRIVVSAGFVDVDRAAGRAVVELTTPDGSFWANGTYPLDWK